MKLGLAGGGRRTAGSRAPGGRGLAAALARARARGRRPRRRSGSSPWTTRQTDHLKAYGLTYWVLAAGAEGRVAAQLPRRLVPAARRPGHRARGQRARRHARAHGRRGGGRHARRDRRQQHGGGRAGEGRRKIAVYIPPNTPPWDDAVTLALDYAEIPYARVWDEEVLRGELAKYDWLHLHHEDFTGQHGKFYAAYHTLPLVPGGGARAEGDGGRSWASPR